MLLLTGLHNRLLSLLMLFFLSLLGSIHAAPSSLWATSENGITHRPSLYTIYAIDGTEAGHAAKEKGSGNVDDAVREADDLYTHLVALLKSVDGMNGYRSVRDSIRILWSSLATLESRYPDVDPDALSNALFENDEFVQLGSTFDEELDRIHRDFPDVTLSLNTMIRKEMQGKMSKRTLTAFDGMISLYKEVVAALESVKSAQDAERAYDTLHALALRLKEAEVEYQSFRDEFQLLVGSDSLSFDLSNRMNAAFARLLADSDMKPVFDALEPLTVDTPTGDENLLADEITAQERQALDDFGVALQKTVLLFEKIKNPEDVETYRAELLDLMKLEQEFNELLPGERGERLIESDPYLVKLLQQLGKEQLRIGDNPELNAKLSLIFEENAQ